MGFSDDDPKIFDIDAQIQTTFESLTDLQKANLIFYSKYSLEINMAQERAISSQELQEVKVEIEGFNAYWYLIIYPDGNITLSSKPLSILSGEKKELTEKEFFKLKGTKIEES